MHGLCRAKLARFRRCRYTPNVNLSRAPLRLGRFDTSRGVPMQGPLLSSHLQSELDTAGVVRVPDTLTNDALANLWHSISPESSSGAVASKTGVYGARTLLASRPRLRRVISELRLDELAGDALGRRAFAIDASYFDKNSEANWAVPAHQDLVVPMPKCASGETARHVRTRDGVTYGQPPLNLLATLVAMRIHFDDSVEDTGGLAFVIGSHTRERWTDVELRQLSPSAFCAYDCRVGDVLLMKPLVVHRSPRARVVTRRRVLHVLFAPLDGEWDVAASPGG